MGTRDKPKDQKTEARSRSGRIQGNYLELNLICLIDISQVIKEVMTIPDKAKNLCKCRKAQQNTGTTENCKTHCY
jgi:hypothetical protein